MRSLSANFFEVHNTDMTAKRGWLISGAAFAFSMSIAANTTHMNPDCPADVWHPLPSKLVCVGDEDMLDFTCLNPDELNPVLRYRTGDAGRIVSCACGDPRPALQVLGRRDGLIKFRGHLVNVADLLGDVGARPGVARAQLVVKDGAERGSILELLLLPSGGPDPGLAAAVREHIVGSAFGPSIVFQRNPHSLEVTVVDKLIGNDRTGKIPSLVIRSEP